MKPLRNILEERNRSEVAKAPATELRLSYVPEADLPPRLATLLARIREAGTPDVVSDK